MTNVGEESNVLILCLDPINIYSVFDVLSVNLSLREACSLSTEDVISSLQALWIKQN